MVGRRVPMAPHTGQVGRDSVLDCGSPQPGGPWRAPFRFSACIGTMNLWRSPSPVLRTPSPPAGERDGVRGRGSWRAPFRFSACIGTISSSLSSSSKPSHPIADEEVGLQSTLVLQLPFTWHAVAIASHIPHDAPKEGAEYPQPR